MYCARAINITKYRSKSKNVAFTKIPDSTIKFSDVATKPTKEADQFKKKQFNFSLKIFQFHTYRKKRFGRDSRP